MNRIQKKPRCKLVGENGNIFNLLAIARKTRKETGYDKEADEMFNKVTKTHNYYEALSVISDYVEIC